MIDRFLECEIFPILYAFLILEPNNSTIGIGKPNTAPIVTPKTVIEAMSVSLESGIIEVKFRQ